MELHNLPYLFIDSRAERKKSLHMVNHYNYSELILVDFDLFESVINKTNLPQKQKCKIENMNHGKTAFWIAEGKAYNFHGTKYAEYLNKDQIVSLLPTCITIFISR